MKKVKKYNVTCVKHRDDKTYNSGELTLPELIKYYSYTLEVGKSYEKEKGNSKINMNPKNIESLVKNLSAAVNNSAADGYAGKHYIYNEII